MNTAIHQKATARPTSNGNSSHVDKVSADSEKGLVNDFKLRSTNQVWTDSGDNGGNSSMESFGVQNFSNISILPSSISRIQTKLKINEPGDKYEQEADQVADQVMRMPMHAIQRKCATCDDEEMIQTKSKGSTRKMVSSSLGSQIQNTKGGGQVMDAGIRSFMEPRFGTDFSAVKIHDNDQAARMNQEINAKAFTVGRDIYFNKGAYNPEGIEGKKLLAHELTHVLQQSGLRSKENHLISNKLSPAIQRVPLTAAEQQTFDQAMVRVQQLDTRLHGFLTAAPLNGASTNIFTDTQTSQGVTTTTNFMLEVKAENLTDAFAFLDRQTVAAPAQSPSGRTRTVNMVMTIDPPTTNANAATELAESLYHEGLHLLIQIDRFTATGTQFVHLSGLRTYEQTARAHADFSGLRTELINLVTPKFESLIRNPGDTAPLPPDVQQRIQALSLDFAESATIMPLVEEKYVENIVAPAMPRSVQPNANFALNEILVRLQGVGFTEPELAAQLDALRRIAALAKNILDALDQIPRSPQPTPPTPSTPTPSTPTPSPKK